MGFITIVSREAPADFVLHLAVHPEFVSTHLDRFVGSA
jgi:hypothetical protein